jgi:hypothetical protein
MRIGQEGHAPAYVEQRRCVPRPDAAQKILNVREYVAHRTRRHMEHTGRRLGDIA